MTGFLLFEQLESGRGECTGDERLARQARQAAHDATLIVCTHKVEGKCEFPGGRLKFLRRRL